MVEMAPLDQDEVRVIALEALAEIEATPRGWVRASRKGICAAIHRAGGKGTRYVGPSFVFRRVGGVVRLEYWPGDSCEIQSHALPDDLEERAGKMLDSL